MVLREEGGKVAEEEKGEPSNLWPFFPLPPLYWRSDCQKRGSGCCGRVDQIDPLMEIRK